MGEVEHAFSISSESELSRAEQIGVHRFRPEKPLLDRARPFVADATSFTKVPFEESDVLVTAKLLGALEDSRIPRQSGTTKPDAIWLLLEAKLLQGKDASPIVANMFGSVGIDLRR